MKRSANQNEENIVKHKLMNDVCGSAESYKKLNCLVIRQLSTINCFGCLQHHMACKASHGAQLGQQKNKEVWSVETSGMVTISPAVINFRVKKRNKNVKIHCYILAVPVSATRVLFSMQGWSSFHMKLNWFVINRYCFSFGLMATYYDF